MFHPHSYLMGDRLLSNGGAGGNCARPMRLPDPSPVLDKNRAPMGPEISSSTGAGVWRKAPAAFPDSGSVLDKFSLRFKVQISSLRSGALPGSSLKKSLPLGISLFLVRRRNSVTPIGTQSPFSKTKKKTRIRSWNIKK